MSLLDVRALTVTYKAGGGDIPAVRGVDLSVAAGEKVGIAGESGCGKSTLALALLRLLPANARLGGEILFDGDDVLTMSFGQLRAVRWAGASVVFQGAMHALNPVRRVEEQIAEPILVHGGDKRTARVKAAELLDDVGLGAGKGRAYPHELSGGQKQRVMIAMALACTPKLIVADEPVSALDVSVQAQVLNLMRDLQADFGVTYLFISHDLAVVEYLCDEVAVMQQGRIVERGAAAEVFRAPRHPYTRALLDAVPTLEP